jgi:hypothetical protein
MANQHALQHATDAGEFDRNRYNAAFDELGLAWHWDEKTYADLHSIHRDKSPVHAYVERHAPHLLAAYDSEFLVGIVEAKRSQLGD